MPLSRIVIAACLALAVTCVAGALAAAAAEGQPPAGGRLEIKHIWFYCHPSLGDEKSLERTIELMQRAAKAGYTGIVLVENKMQRWSQVDEKYLSNMKKFRQACRDLKLDCVAACLPLGYANDLMSNDPNLAEGMPVVDAPFAVKDGRLVPDEAPPLVNGSFEDVKGGVPAGWTVDMPGRIGFADAAVTHDGKPSLRLEEPEKHDPQFLHCRAWQKVPVKPFRYYHLSCWVKTEGFRPSGDTRLMALAGGDRFLDMPELPGIQQTQDWKLYHKTFNTQGYTEVDIYIGSWGARTGRIWYSDVRMEPGGLVNMLRRDGTPFKAKAADGNTILEEGKDLPEMKDPLLGKSPYLGGYQWHAQPEVKLPAGSRLKEGDKALLSYYHTAVMCYNDQVPICLAEPKIYDWIKWHIAGIAKNLQPDYYFMEHDEIRMQGWDESCRRTGKTCGGILADNIRRCTEIIRKEDPGKGIFVWSDMFDPFHNAEKTGPYLICKGDGPWYGSWEGLPKEVGLINWNSAKAESVRFFAKEGHPQILSSDNPGAVVGALKNSAADAARSIVGVIYTTWSDDFGGNFEGYPKAVRDFEKEQNASK